MFAGSFSLDAAQRLCAMPAMDEWAVLDHLGALVDKLAERPGAAVVFITSINGVITSRHLHYGAAKAGLLGLSRSVAREYASRGITCNVVAPGPIVTSMTEGLGEEWMSNTAQHVPLGRFGTAEECAATIAFLCSDEAGYITGVLLPVDGGLGMGH